MQLYAAGSYGPSSEDFLATWWLFECNNTYCITVLGCLKKEKEDEQFQPFQVIHLRTSLDIDTIHCYCSNHYSLSIEE